MNDPDKDEIETHTLTLDEIHEIHKHGSPMFPYPCECDKCKEERKAKDD